MFQVNGRVDNYLWDFHTYLNNLSNAFDFSGKIYTSFPDYFEAFDEAVYQIQTNTRRIYNNLDSFIISVKRVLQFIKYFMIL